MTTRISLNELFYLLRMRTWGSEPSHTLVPAAAGFSPPEILDKKLPPKIGERSVVGVVGVVGDVDSLGAPSDATDSGGGDGL